MHHLNSWQRAPFEFIHAPFEFLMHYLNSWLGTPLAFLTALIEILNAPLQSLNAPLEFLNASFEFLTGSTIWSPNCCNWNPPCICRMKFTMVWWENATAHRFLTRAIDFKRQYNDFQRSPKKKHNSTAIIIEFERCWIIAQRFTLMFTLKARQRTNFIDFLYKRTTVHRFSSNVNDFEWSSDGVHRFETILKDRTKMFIDFQINSTTVYRIALMFNKNTSLQRYSLSLNDFERLFKYFHRFRMMLNDSVLISIFPLQEHDRTTKFFDCWCKNTTVQRFPSMLKDFERPYNGCHRLKKAQ